MYPDPAAASEVAKQILLPQYRGKARCCLQVARTTAGIFRALLLSKLPHNEYERIVSYCLIVVRPIDMESVVEGEIITSGKQVTYWYLNVPVLFLKSPGEVLEKVVVGGCMHRLYSAEPDIKEALQQPSH
ncbi:hypothetical protein EDC04DRAFT_2601129 [Pisolithus marmoratus]|nr:hypothetical protein EDC04DRAFT_2601129 [Pisolithus marmoratus]